MLEREAAKGFMSAADSRYKAVRDIAKSMGGAIGWQIVLSYDGNESVEPKVYALAFMEAYSKGRVGGALDRKFVEQSPLNNEALTAALAMGQASKAKGKAPAGAKKHEQAEPSGQEASEGKEQCPTTPIAQ